MVPHMLGQEALEAICGCFLGHLTLLSSQSSSILVCAAPSHIVVWCHHLGFLIDVINLFNPKFFWYQGKMWRCRSGNKLSQPSLEGGNRDIFFIHLTSSQIFYHNLNPFSFFYFYPNLDFFQTSGCDHHAEHLLIFIATPGENG